MFDKQSRKDIQKVWQEFQISNPLGTNDCRETILDSWKRSKQYGVKALNVDIKLHSLAEVKKRQENSMTLLNAAREYLENIYTDILDCQGVVVLSDSDCVIIYALGDEKTMQGKNVFELGSDCKEETIGTNGVGTCLTLRKSVQIWAEEHYCQDFHHWYCSGTPIFDPEGNILGCLNVTGSSESVHMHTQGMVIGVGNAIERQIRVNQITAENQKVIQKQEIMLNLISDGVLIIDSVGNLTDINDKALQLLDMPKNEIMNQPLKNIIPSGIDIQDIFTYKRMLKNVEVRFALPRKDLSCHISTAIIEYEQGLPESIILTFTQSKNVKDLVNKVTGSMAKYTFEQLIGTSSIFEKVIQQGKLAASTNSNVLITGESGTGKELMAQAIHNASDRLHMPFVTINCGALPRGLVESELFGYEGGAFTGSKKEGNPGKFELADGGTIFLDEIGDMPLDVQVALLRVIQEKEVNRIGGSKPKRIDVRIIAATNRNLEEEVLNKTFRHDLFYRLHVLAINMPSLRDRKADLELLTNSILAQIRRQAAKPYLAIDGQAIDLLKSYDWPGNIRELENVLERAAYICTDSVITFRDLLFNSHPNDARISPDINVLKQTEMGLIMDTLTETNGNIRQAAGKLGISRNTIYAKLKKYNIPR